MDEDRARHRVSGFQLGQKLVQIMDVPGAFDLGQHYHVQLVAAGGDNLGQVVERPGAVERIYPGPKARRAEIVCICEIDEPGAGGFLCVGGDGVLQVAEDHVDLGNEFRHLGANFLDMRRDEVNHALQPHRNFTIRIGRADGQGREKPGRCPVCIRHELNSSLLRLEGKGLPGQANRLLVHIYWPGVSRIHCSNCCCMATVISRTSSSAFSVRGTLTSRNATENCD